MSGEIQDRRHYRMVSRAGSGPLLDPPTPPRQECPKCGGDIDVDPLDDVAWCLDCDWDSGPPGPPEDRLEDLEC